MSRPVSIVVVLLLVAGGGFWWWKHQHLRPAPAAPPAPVAAPPAPPPPPPPAEPAIRHPIPAARDQGGLPSLDQSDRYIHNALVELLGRRAV